MNGNDFFRLYDVNDNPEDYKIKYLFEGVLPLKGFSSMIGKTGSGKSLLAMRIAASLATGELIGYLKNPKLDWPIDFGYPHHPGATLYYSGEGQDGMLGRMIAARNALPVSAIESLSPAFGGQLPIICVGKVKRRLSMDKQISEMQELIKQKAEFYAFYNYPLRLFIIDTLVASFELDDENSNSEMQNMVDTITGYGHALGCHVMVLGHPSKSGHRVKGDNRGASTLKNSADVILELQKIKNSDDRSLTITNIRDGVGEGAVFTFGFKVFDDVPALVPAEQPIAPQQEEIKQRDKILSGQEKLVLDIIAEAPDGKASRKYIYEELLKIAHIHVFPKDQQPQMRDRLRQARNRAVITLLNKGKITLFDYDADEKVYRVTTTLNEPATNTNMNISTPTSDPASEPTQSYAGEETTDEENFDELEDQSE